MKKVVVMGSSTGGPKVLELFFKLLPTNFPAPIIIAQHHSEPFTKSIANRLNKISGFHITTAKTGEIIKNNHAYFVPGNCHFFITEPGPKFSLLETDDILKPSVDMGITSVTEYYGPGTIAVILTGMGDDGVIGAKAVKQLNGHVLVQDENTSKHRGMPKAVLDAGYVDDSLPLNGLVLKLIELCS
jgi:two-component system, chemotaxis family, protein-glutamate methylesterase/glutaminase